MEYLTIFAIIIGPTIGVLITLWSNKRKEKHRQRMTLFLTLLAYRKTYPIPDEFINSLNMIDVVFHKNNKVINSWKLLFASYHVDPFIHEIASRKLLDLLDEMAKSLGYLHIKQTDFDSFYSPINEAERNARLGEIEKELLRVLKNSQSLGTLRQSNQNIQK